MRNYKWKCPRVSDANDINFTNPWKFPRAKKENSIICKNAMYDISRGDI